MPNSRDLNLDRYGISKWKFRELKYFCLQYKEKKQEVEDIIGLHGVSFDGMPKGTQIGSAVENQIIKLYDLNDDVKVIEDTAAEADDTISGYIIKNVTESIPYEYMDVPCGRRQFYQARRKFFFLLSKKR